MKFKTLLICLISFALPANSLEQVAPSPKPTLLTLTAKNSGLGNFFKLLAEQADLTLSMDPTIQTPVSYSFTETSLNDILETVTRDNKLNYAVEGKTLTISKAVVSGVAVGHDVYRFNIRNALAKDLLAQVPSIYKKEDALILDESTNSLIFTGDSVTYKRLEKIVQALDHLTRQILIEAEVVETDNNFFREFGFQWGKMTSSTSDVTTPPKAIGKIDVGTDATPSFSLNYLLGSVDKQFLEARLLAAENTGQAKIISRPKIIVTNNEAALISSGITFNIKVETTSQAGVTSGTLQKITAGLQLKVTPTLLGDNRIRLKVEVSNSEARESLSRDGVPGISDNSASTVIIVNNGSTVTMAGLKKNSNAESEKHVPLLSQIPVLGWFFRSKMKRNLESEMAVILTSKIIDPAGSTETAMSKKPLEGNL